MSSVPIDQRKKPTTTLLYIRGLPWSVPRGFGVYYRELAHNPATAQQLSDMLCLIGYDAKPKDIARQSLRTRVEAEAYAARSYMRAADNIVRVPPKPSWLPQARKGAELTPLFRERTKRS